MKFFALYLTDYHLLPIYPHICIYQSPGSQESKAIMLDFQQPVALEQLSKIPAT